MALDRNLSNSIGASTASVIANQGSNFAALNGIEDARFKDTKDNINRNSDFLLNDARRTADFGMNNVNRNSDVIGGLVIVMQM